MLARGKSEESDIRKMIARVKIIAELKRGIGSFFLGGEGNNRG